MTNLIIRYRTRPDAADENAHLIADVFKELATVDTAGFSYTAYRLEDGVTFTHVVWFEEGKNPLRTLPAFAEFQREILSRCVEGPVTSEATVVGSTT